MHLVFRLRQFDPMPMLEDVIPEHLMEKATADEFLGEMLCKAFLKKVPYVAGPGGTKRIDYKRIPVGGTIFITIKKESSPLKGRVIPITKRPDGKFAVDFEAGRRAGYKYGEWAKRVAAQSHAAFDPEAGREEREKREKKEREEKERGEKPVAGKGKLKPEKKLTPEEEARRERIEEARAEKRRALEREKQKAILAGKKAVEEVYEELGAGKDSHERTVENIKAKAKEKAEDAGLEGAAKEAFVDTVVDRLQKEDLRIRKRNLVKLQEATAKGEEFTPEEAVIDIPDATDLKGKDEYEVQVATSAKMEEVIKEAGKTGRITTKIKGSRAVIGIGMDKKKLREAVHDPQKMKRLMRQVEKLGEATAQEIQAREKLRALRHATEPEIKELSIDLKVTPEEIKAQEKALRSLDTMSELGFYDHLRNLSNKGVEALIEYQNAGAGSALSVLMDQLGGGAMQMGQLVNALGMENAAYAAAAMLYDKLGGRGFRSAINKLEKQNAENLPATERKALMRYAELRKQEKEIAKQVKRGELKTPQLIEQYTAENLLRQRKELGIAYGSLAVSGTLMAAMHSVAANKGVANLEINCGAFDNAQRMQRDLGFKVGRKFAEEHYIQRNPDGTFSLRLTTKDIEPYLKKYQVDAAIAEKNRAIIENDTNIGMQKTMAGTRYKPKSKAQRNAVNYQKAHPKGAMMALSTGAGKTILAWTDFHDYLQRTKGRGRGIYISHRGGSSETLKQWNEETSPEFRKRAVYIPEKASESTIRRILENLPAGKIAIMDNTQAAKVPEAIERMTKRHKTVIYGDELHELKNPKGEQTEKGRILFHAMKSAESLRAYTASPVKEHMSEIYAELDLVTHGEFSKKVKRETFNSLFKTLGHGTNAQDAALLRTMRGIISPYLMTDARKERNYKVSRHIVKLRRNKEMIAAQKKIESGSKAYIDRYLKSKERELKAKHGSHTVASPGGLWRKAHGSLFEEKEGRKYNEKSTRDRARAMELYKEAGGTFHQPWRRKGIEEAVANIKRMHGDVLSRMQISESSKQIPRILKKLGMQNQKTMIYVSGAAQRDAIIDYLKKAKMNIPYDTPMGRPNKSGIIEAWQKKEGPGILFISRDEAAGFNIPRADNLIMAAAPDDATTRIQAWSRGDRPGKREAGRDYRIVELFYEDSVLDRANKDRMDQMFNLTRMFSPAMDMPEPEEVR